MSNESEFEDLRPDESEVAGALIDLGSRVVADSASARIRWLTRERLALVGRPKHGEGTAYRDPRDGRYWLLTYPFFDLPEQGPPHLRLIPADEVAPSARPEGS